MLTCKNRFIWMLLLVMALSFASAVPAMGQMCPTAGKVWSPAGSALPAAVVGQPYSRQVTVSCPPASGCGAFSAYTTISTLPPGLSISPTGLIAGIPLTAGFYGFSVQATQFCMSGGPDNPSNPYSITVVTLSVSGSVSPSSYSAPSTVTTTQGLTYTFTTTPSATTTMISTQGTFQVGGTTIGTNSSLISAIIVSGRGSVSEAITVLPSVMQTALSMGSSRMTYNRTFTNGTNTVTTQVTISITSEAGANLLITRMQLYFQNRMPMITIKRSDPMLKAYVDINYVGSGLLQGYWEVDGNLLTNVKQSITTGRTVTIESPSPPLLSTFIPGEHQIRFVVTSPSQNIPFPQINYYVTPEETAVKKLASLDLLSPNDQGAIDYEPTTFLWNRSEGISTYFLQFFLKGEEKPVFSAYARNPAYRLPDAVIKTFFSRGKTYAWKVKGLDSSNIMAAESPLFIFSIRE